MTQCPKHNPWRSRPYLDWLKAQRCVLTNCKPCDPHHVKMFGNGGMAIKPPDDDALPILHEVHQRLDSPWHSELSVFSGYWPELHGDKEAIRARLRELCREHRERWGHAEG